MSILFQLLLSLSILVITHELGHFLFAKLFGIRVNKFYLFFDPWFSLFKFKRGDTEYGIGWLPLGGYCQIAGMIDETQDSGDLASEPQPWEFRSKPAWQRLLVMIGGVLVNALTAPLIFWLLLYGYGDTYVPLSEARWGLEYSEPLKQCGLRDGDRIVDINGQACETYKEAANAIIFSDPCTLRVERGGEVRAIELPHEFFREILKDDRGQLLGFLTPVVVDSVLPGSAASSAGLARGDSIVSVRAAGRPLGVDTLALAAADSAEVASARGMLSFTAFRATLDTLRGAPALLVVARPSGGLDTLTVQVSEAGTIGFYGADATRWFTPTTRHFGLLEALPEGVSRGYELAVNYCKQLPMLFTKEGATKVGGFGTIAGLFPDSWNWHAFWFNTAFLAIILAIMNILPIPALDGGHVLFLLIEVVTGRRASDRVLEVAQMIGMALLFALLIYANGADLVRWLAK